METNLRELIREWTVAKMRDYELISVERGASVRQAVDRMAEAGVGSVLVMDAGQLAGIFTERDFLLGVLGTGASVDAPVQEFMTAETVEAYLDDPICAVLEQMNTGGYKHMPVLDRSTNRPVGTIGVRCAVAMLAECLPNAIYNLPPDAGRYPASREGG